MPRSRILLFARYRMDIALAYPEGFGLSPEIAAKAEENTADHGGRIPISNDTDDAFRDADSGSPGVGRLLRRNISGGNPGEGSATRRLDL